MKLCLLAKKYEFDTDKKIALNSPLSSQQCLLSSDTKLCLLAKKYEFDTDKKTVLNSPLSLQQCLLSSDMKLSDSRMF